MSNTRIPVACLWTSAGDSLALYPRGLFIKHPPIVLDHQVVTPEQLRENELFVEDICAAGLVYTSYYLLPFLGIVFIVMEYLFLSRFGYCAALGRLFFIFVYARLPSDKC